MTGICLSLGPRPFPRPQRSRAEKGEGKGRKGSGKYGAPSTGKSWNVGSGVKNVIRSNLLNLDWGSSLAAHTEKLWKTRYVSPVV